MGFQLTSIVCGFRELELRAASSALPRAWASQQRVCLEGWVRGGASRLMEEKKLERVYWRPQQIEH